MEGTPLRWFTSYLTGRRKYCQINGHKSSLKTVHCGFPQGSCLGPLLFNLHVNDFEQCLKKCTSNMFADDTSVTCSAEDIYDLCNDLKAEIDNIAEWLRQNKLKAEIHHQFFVSFCSSVEICDVFSTDEAKLSVFLKVWRAYLFSQTDQSKLYPSRKAVAITPFNGLSMTHFE